jgi:tricarballylate dehydrogenase
MDALDVVVVGGDAALCATLAAEENGTRVAVLERAPQEESGGSSFTVGAIRSSCRGADDLQEIMPDLTPG